MIADSTILLYRYKRVTDLSRLGRNHVGVGMCEEQFYDWGIGLISTNNIICGECGSSFCGNARKEQPNHRAYVSYMCQKRNGSIQYSNSEIKREAFEAFVLDRLADHIYDERKIPSIFGSYEKYLRSRDKDKICLIDSIKNQIAQINKEIKNIVTVVAKTGSEALIERLTENEHTKKELEYRFDKLSEETAAYKITTVLWNRLKEPARY